MAEQVFYEDVELGSEIPALVKRTTRRQLVQWAGASGDFYEIHYDEKYAKSQGLPGVIVHGRLKVAFLGQLITDWIGTEGTLRKLACSYHGIDFPDEDIVCKGKVSKKYIKDGENYIELDVWTENPRGEKTTRGAASVVLPLRG
jgi:acyl dehydratase